MSSSKNLNPEKYQSWGRYPRLKAKEVLPIFWKNELPVFKNFKKPVLAYAFGKSYGDSCLNENGVLLDTKALNRFISIDWEKGLVRCEAGVTLATVLDFILPKGWFLAVTPGTKHISVAGALANDVHGKNHHKEGTFGCTVTQFELVRSDGSRLICSREENVDLFKATIGGLGLTGLITWVEFRIIKCPTPFFYTESIKFNNLEEFFEINEESDKNFDYIVSWIDTTASGGSLGRGIFNRGNILDPEKYAVPKIPKSKVKNFPFEAPFINSLSVHGFNVLYFNKQQTRKIQGISHYDNFFYPLDAVNFWNKAYGKNGFVQYQFVTPKETSFKAVSEILKIISSSGLSSFLTVLKQFGDVESPGMLSFPRPGFTMAVDFRFTGERTLELCRKLDNIVRNSGGVLYPAKDARMSGEDFRRFYPQWVEFSKYIDPCFSSSFWRRVMR